MCWYNVVSDKRGILAANLTKAGALKELDKYFDLWQRLPFEHIEIIDTRTGETIANMN